jgi:hypothetical protein
LDQWLQESKSAEETKNWLDEEFAALQAIMAELGLARQQ